MRVLLCSAALVLSARHACVGTWIVPLVSDHPVACPPQWLPMLLASSSHEAFSTRRRMKDAINPGCTAHFVMDDVGGLPDAASMMPAYVTLDGVQIGYPEDGTTQKTSCDQIAAVRGTSVRGTSGLITQGFSVGIIGTAGEEIEFKYWNEANQQEYSVEFRYTMEANGLVGSFNQSQGGAQELVLSLPPPLAPPPPSVPPASPAPSAPPSQPPPVSPPPSLPVPSPPSLPPPSQPPPSPSLPGA